MTPSPTKINRDTESGTASSGFKSLIGSEERAFVGRMWD